MSTYCIASTEIIKVLQNLIKKISGPKTTHLLGYGGEYFVRMEKMPLSKLKTIVGRLRKEIEMDKAIAAEAAEEKRTEALESAVWSLARKMGLEKAKALLEAGAKDD